MDTLSLLQRLQRPDLEDLDEDDHIIDWVSAFTGDAAFVECVETFTSAHAHEFESKDGAEAEYSLRHTELYHEFLEMTEAKIEAFLATKGYDPSAFYKLCRQEIERAEARQRNSTRSFFVQLLLAGSEFEVFASMMREASTAAAEARERLRATVVELKTLLEHASWESKADDGDDHDGHMFQVTPAQRKVLSAECSAVSAWLLEHPSASLAELAARETAMEEVVNPLLIEGDQAGRARCSSGDVLEQLRAHNKSGSVADDEDDAHADSGGEDEGKR